MVVLGLETESIGLKKMGSQDGSRANRYDQRISICQSSPGGSPVAMRFADFFV